MHNHQLKVWLIIGMLVCLSVQKNYHGDYEDFEAIKNKYYYLPIFKTLNQNFRQKDGMKDTFLIKSPKIVKDEMIVAALRAEPDAEMLPVDYTGIKSPGVDHMEMINESVER